MVCMKELNVFISAGEASADILGAQAIRDTRALLPDNVRIVWRGLAGTAMREAGALPELDSPAPSAAGLLELLPRARELFRFRSDLYAAAFKRHYDLAALIDMPDLHLPLGRRLKAAGVPVLLYVPPQTWAWRSGRATELESCCRRVAVLFEFEKRHLERYGLAAQYVGHPLFADWRTDGAARRPNVETGIFRVALMPGSRRHEVEHNLPPMLEAAKILNGADTPCFEFELIYNTENLAAISGMLDPLAGVALKPRRDMQPENYDLAFCGAGTASLELAAAGTPFMLCHRVNQISYMLARRLVKPGLAAMPNILAGYAVAPELIQQECRAARIADEAQRICSDGGLERQRRAWRRLGAALKAQPRDATIAGLILDMLDIKGGDGTSSENV